jgi:outer membrane protein TolC
MRPVGFLVILASLGVGHAALAQQPAKPAQPAPAAAPAPAAPEPVVAPPGEAITLRDALAQAVKGNRALASAAVDVQIAQGQRLQAEGVDDFLIDASANALLSRTEPTSFNPFPVLELNRFDLAGGISRNLSTGGRIGVRAEYELQTGTARTIDFDAMGNPMIVDIDFTQHTPRVSLNLFQPLLRGYGENNVLRAPLRRAAAQLTIAELQRAQVASTVVFNVVQAYWELAYAQRNVEIERAGLALAREQLRITQARLDVGVGARTDLAAVEQNIASREAFLLSAELAVSERGYDLRSLIGMEITAQSIGLLATDRLEPAGGELTLDQALERAMAANPQLAVVRAQGEAAQIEVEVTENGLLPQLDFTANAGPVGNSDNASDSFSQLVSFDSYSVNLGLVFSMPIGNRAARGANQQAVGQVRKVKLGQRDLEAQIAVATARAVNLVSTTRKQLEALDTASRLAQVNLDAEHARFDVGKSTNFDVLQRQEELSLSDLRRARAQADYLRAVAQLQTLTGDILSSYGVELRKK